MKSELFFLFLSFFLFMFLAWFYYSRARHKERLMLIEKGINPDSFSETQKQTGPPLGLKVGIVIIGLSIGLTIISVLVHFNALGSGNATPLAIIGLSLGVSLVISNRYKKS